MTPIEVAFVNWFHGPGAYVLVDGQYGSTGKGVLAAAMAEKFWQNITHVISNAGPNSGHTSYWDGEKIVLKQLPTFSVIARKASKGADRITTVLSAGAVIDTNLLSDEMGKYGITRLDIHPNAALITDAAREVDKTNVESIASTGQGVGPAIINKIRRRPSAVWGGGNNPPYIPDRREQYCFMEVSQGFSLGINSGFYPHVTSRECTVSQALADAGLPPSFHRETVMCCRTFPIRVGSTENSSGPCYYDQKELTWHELGVPPEMTTVTGRVRRVFTWSIQQFKDSLLVNRPGVIFLNFVNYLPQDKVEEFVEINVAIPYSAVLNRFPIILLGYGPRSEDIRLWN